MLFEGGWEASSRSLADGVLIVVCSHSLCFAAYGMGPHSFCLTNIALPASCGRGVEKQEMKNELIAPRWSGGGGCSQVWRLHARFLNHVRGWNNRNAKSTTATDLLSLRRKPTQGKLHQAFALFFFLGCMMHCGLACYHACRMPDFDVGIVPCSQVFEPFGVLCRHSTSPPSTVIANRMLQAVL